VGDAFGCACVASEDGLGDAVDALRLRVAGVCGGYEGSASEGYGETSDRSVLLVAYAVFSQTQSASQLHGWASIHECGSAWTSANSGSVQSSDSIGAVGPEP
jgi:hypothetical protein